MLHLQVSNWFINARVRLWKPMVEDMYQQELKEAEGAEEEREGNQSSSNNSGHQLAQTPTPSTTASTATAPPPHTPNPPPHSTLTHSRVNDPVPEAQKAQPASPRSPTEPPFFFVLQLRHETHRPPPGRGSGTRRPSPRDSRPLRALLLPPLPAQRNLTPPPTLYPQQPVSVSENYSFPRFSLSGSSEISTVARTKRSDINV